MMVWCGEKEECQCVVIHCIPGMLMCSVWSVVDEWKGKKGGFGGKWLREREERVENQKTQIQLQLSKSHNSLSLIDFPPFFLSHSNTRKHHKHSQWDKALRNGHRV